MCKQHNEDWHHGKENERTRKKGQNERQRKATDENQEKRKGEGGALLPLLLLL